MGEAALIWSVLTVVGLVVWWLLTLPDDDER